MTKFIVFASVVLALAFSVQASVVPLLLSAQAPVVYSSANVLGIGSSPITIPASTLPDGTHLYRAPLVTQWPLGWNAEGTYTAKTLGSEHVAPLPGHFISATSSNLDLAPGTKKEDFPSSSVKAKSEEISLYAPYPYALNSHATPLLFTAPIAPFTDGTIVTKSLL